MTPRDGKVRQEIPRRQAPFGTVSRLCKRTSNAFISQGNTVFLPQLKVRSLSSRNYKQIQFWQSPLGKMKLMSLSKIPLLLSLFLFPPGFHSCFMLPCILRPHCILFSFKWANQGACFPWNITFFLWTSSSVFGIKTLGPGFTSFSTFKAATISPGQSSKWGYTFYN